MLFRRAGSSSPFWRSFSSIWAARYLPDQIQTDLRQDQGLQSDGRACLSFHRSGVVRVPRRHSEEAGQSPHCHSWPRNGVRSNRSARCGYSRLRPSQSAFELLRYCRPSLLPSEMPDWACSQKEGKGELGEQTESTTYISFRSFKSFRRVCRLCCVSICVQKTMR